MSMIPGGDNKEWLRRWDHIVYAPRRLTKRVKQRKSLPGQRQIFPDMDLRHLQPGKIEDGVDVVTQPPFDKRKK